MNDSKIQESLKVFLGNPYWRKYYETSPTDACKRYIELEFYYSEHLGKIPDYSRFANECKRLEKEFIKTDWEHLYKYCANNPRKAYYRNKIKEAKK